MMTLLELAAKLNAQCIGPAPMLRDVTITHVDNIPNADAHAIVFAQTTAMLTEALASNAGAVLLTSALAATVPAMTKPGLCVREPRMAFSLAAIYLRVGIAATQPEIHTTAILGKGTKLGAGVAIGAYAVLGDGVEIGDQTQIAAGCVIGDGVSVGAACKLYPRVVIYAGTTLGDRVIVHAGSVLGADGFGYVRDAATGAYTQFPQQGTLVIEEDVEIGANTTIDRGALEQTRIARGTKLDNLVHIGHNVRVGQDVVIAAQTGISGSSTVGDGAVLGGQVGVGEHAELGPHVILGGGAGALSQKKLRGAGMVFWGRPAQPLRAYLKGLAAVAKLARKQKDIE